MSSEKLNSNTTKDPPKAETGPGKDQGKANGKSGSDYDPVGEDALKMFPERRGGIHNSGGMIYNDRTFNRENCEFRVLTILKNYPLIKLLEQAMKAHGCDIDYRRHFSCEPCVGKVTGGYDLYHNQIVICDNKWVSKGQIMGTVGHEMIHMFDACRSKLDFQNPEHVACTEIRAANLMHCTLQGSIFKGTTPLYRWSDTQKECVREKAFLSLIASLPHLDHVEAYKIVDKVFDRCYNDLEPFGRNIQNFTDSLYAYRERFHHGYF